MAPARRAVEPQLRGLSYNLGEEPLHWKPSKPIPAKVLIERLDKLSKELKTLDQDETDKDSVAKVAKELAHDNLLEHRDRGVRAFTACCLVDILRICAPVAPLNKTHLTRVFTCFIASILPSLSTPSNAYNVQHMYVLNSLSEVKSILLITELPSPDALVVQLFRKSFDILYSAAKTSTGEQIGQKVLNDLTNLLVCLVDEMQNLPADAVDVIVAPFFLAKAMSVRKDEAEEEDPKQLKLMPKELPPAYNTAKAICEFVPAKMARYISQYFNECMIDVSETMGVARKSTNRKSARVEDSDDEDMQAGPSAAELDDLDKAHQLLREVWRACPDVLQNVIPQLEAELSVEDVQLRLLATQTLGDIISGIGSAGPPPSPIMNPSAYPPMMLADAPDSQERASPLSMPLSLQSFAQTHPGTYHSFLARQRDKSAIIRAAWATAVGRIILTSAGGIGLGREDEAQLLKGLASSLGDADEKVRIAGVKVVASFSFRDIITKLAPNGSVTATGSVLGTLSDRVKDVKPFIRVEAMTTLARIWGVAAAEIAAENDIVSSALGGIPSKIFDCFFTNANDLIVLLRQVLFEQLVPLDFPPSKIKATNVGDGQSQGVNQAKSAGQLDRDGIRTERMLIMVRSLDAKSKKAFFAVQSAQPKMSTAMETFLKKCEEYNGGISTDKATEKHLGMMIDWLSKMLPDPLKASADLWKFAKANFERTYILLRWMIEPESDYGLVRKSIKEFRWKMESEKTLSVGFLETLDPIIYRTALLLYNRSHLPAIVQFSRSDEKGLGDTAHEILAHISEHTPDIFKVHVKELCKLLEEQAPSQTKRNAPDSVKTLKACAGFARKYPTEMPTDRKFIQTLLAFAEYGSPPQAAKYAVIILMQATDRKEMHAKDLLLKVIQDWTYGSDHFLTRLATISQLVLLAPEEAREVTDEILDIVTQQVLLNVRTHTSETDKKWQEGSEVDEECQAKCWALKILVNNLRATEDDDEAKELSEPVFKMLNLLVSQEGELSKKKDTPAPHKARLRLLAAQLLLKLCGSKRFNDVFEPSDFIKLACVAQDSLFPVRRDFIDKLQKYLVQQRLSNSFYSINFLMAFEPERPYREMVSTWLRSRVKHFHEKVPPETVLEGSFPRLLSLLAHHPDFSTDPQELIDHAHYIMFFVSTVVSADNLGLVYRYAERVKQTRDGIKGADSDNLYILSELAQSLLRKYAEKKGWAMQAFPGKLRLPAKIFAALPDHTAAQAIADKQYLPDEVEDLLDGVIRSADKKKKRKSTDDGGNPAVKRVRIEKSKFAKEPSVRKVKTPAKEKKARIPKTSNVPESERRRSGRGVVAKEGVSYADRDSDEDDEEMWDGVAKWEYIKGNGDDERNASGSEKEGSGGDFEDADLDVDMKDVDDAGSDAVSDAEPDSASTPATKVDGKPNGKAKEKFNGKANAKITTKSTPVSNTKLRSRATAKKISTPPESQTPEDEEAEESAEGLVQESSPPATKAGRKRTVNKKSPVKTPVSVSKIPTRASRRVNATVAPESEATEPEKAEDSPLSETEASDTEASPVPKTNGKAAALKKGAKGKTAPKEKVKTVESRSRAKSKNELRSSQSTLRASTRTKGKVAAKAKGKDVFDMDSD